MGRVDFAARVLVLLIFIRNEYLKVITFTIFTLAVVDRAKRVFLDAPAAVRVQRDPT